MLSKPKKQHLALGDTLAVIEFVVSMIFYGLAVSIYTRGAAVIFGVAGAVYLAYKSHFVRKWSDLAKNITAASLVVTLAVLAAFQLIPQWKKDHRLEQSQKQKDCTANQTGSATASGTGNVAVSGNCDDVNGKQKQ